MVLTARGRSALPGGGSASMTSWVRQPVMALAVNNDPARSSTSRRNRSDSPAKERGISLIGRWPARFRARGNGRGSIGLRKAAVGIHTGCNATGGRGHFHLFRALVGGVHRRVGAIVQRAVRQAVPTARARPPRARRGPVRAVLVQGQHEYGERLHVLAVP